MEFPNVLNSSLVYIPKVSRGPSTGHNLFTVDNGKTKGFYVRKTFSSPSPHKHFTTHSTKTCYSSSKKRFVRYSPTFSIPNFMKWNLTLVTLKLTLILLHKQTPNTHVQTITLSSREDRDTSRDSIEPHHFW